MLSSGIRLTSTTDHLSLHADDNVFFFAVCLRSLPQAANSFVCSRRRACAWLAPAARKQLHHLKSWPWHPLLVDPFHYRGDHSFSDEVVYSSPRRAKRIHLDHINGAAFVNLQYRRMAVEANREPHSRNDEVRYSSATHLVTTLDPTRRSTVIDNTNLRLCDWIVHDRNHGLEGLRLRSGIPASRHGVPGLVSLLLSMPRTNMYNYTGRNPPPSVMSFVSSAYFQFFQHGIFFILKSFVFQTRPFSPGLDGCFIHFFQFSLSPHLRP